MSQRSGFELPGDGVNRARSDRVERLRHAGAWSASGTVGQFAALRAAGFEPVGQVFGASVLHIPAATRATLPRCTGKGTDLADAPGSTGGLLERGARRVVLERATAECRALGGDGIIGVRLSVVPHPSGGMQFTAEGTAVRAASRIRPATPFTTHVSGPDLARLLGAGWMPFCVLFAFAIGSHHDDTGTWVDTRRVVGAEGNREVYTYTRLVNDTRRAARDQLAPAVQACGGQGVVTAEMTLRVSERECPRLEHQHDHIAEAGFLGSALAALPKRKQAAPRTLSIMRLNQGQEPHWQQPQPSQ